MTGENIKILEALENSTENWAMATAKNTWIKNDFIDLKELVTKEAILIFWKKVAGEIFAKSGNHESGWSKKCWKL